MEAKGIRSVYFLGIGGIGMSAIARYFLWKGVRVAGYDKTPTPLTDQLSREGMEVHFTDDPGRIPADVDLVIWTPAVPKEHSEYRFLSERNIPIRKRAEVLGEIIFPYPTIAVAGTHGKTTTTTMIAHIFHTAGKPMMAFLGGISKDYGTNFIPSSPHPLIPSSLHPHSTCIVEADEFDRSFLHLSPDTAIITSMDADHLDIYHHRDQLKLSFGEFAGKVRSNGSLIIKKGLDLRWELPANVSGFTYALHGKADFTASNVKIRDGLIHFDFVTPEKILPGFILGMPGMFNLENAIAALAAGWLHGITEETLRAAMQRFSGVVRRFDVRIMRSDFVYIDDYAHHPEELHACIQAVKELYPGKKITGVFQPHLFSRTRDLAGDFARVLAELDSLILLEIYPARELPIEGIDSRMLLDSTPLSKKLLCEKENLLNILENQHPEVLLTLGAGDIDQMVEPITERFSKR